MGRSKRLRDRYDGAVEAVPDVLVTLEPPTTLHLPARDRAGPACVETPDREWQHVDSADAVAFGGELCRMCFTLHLEHLARDPSSPVERGDTTADVDAEIVTRAHADGGRPAALTSKTDRVARVTGTSTVYHAPTPYGALCGVQTDDVLDRDLVEGHYRPCKDCFDLDGEQ